MYLTKHSLNASLNMKRNIYTRQEAFWCIVRSRTPFRFEVMIDEEEEEERKKERKKNKIGIFAVRFFDSYKGYRHFASSFALK